MGLKGIGLVFDFVSTVYFELVSALPKNTSKIKMSDSESSENAIKSPYKSPVKMFGWLF